jgi:ubiquinone/menaquinone biosynthesis C-methylase UbiE
LVNAIAKSSRHTHQYVKAGDQSHIAAAYRKLYVGVVTDLNLEKRISDPLARMTTRAAYGASQLPRIAWYVGHSLAVRWLSQAAQRRDGTKARRRAHTNLPVPDRRRIYADMAVLLQQDLANIEAGIYPLPADHDGSLITLLHRSRLFFDDLPEIHRRRSKSAHNEVLNAETRGKRPRYYLQNFHFQSGGWMTDDSANRYDTQVEVLFNGTANATRRQALPQLHEVFAGRDQRKLRFLDVGCGTGCFLDFLKQAWPRLPVLGLDMSESYVRYAKRHLKRWSRINLTVGNAESLPVPDESQDAVTSIFLFHELPPKVRQIVFRECARVLKPGGRLVLVDSLQHGDQPDYEGLLELFPQNYHEPYYSSYTNEDFSGLASSCGLTYTRYVKAFVSKVMVFDKPAVVPAGAFFSKQMQLKASAIKHTEKIFMKNRKKRRAWTSAQVRELKSFAKKKTPAAKIARALKRSEGATRQKAFSMGLSLDSRA